MILGMNFATVLAPRYSLFTLRRVRSPFEWTDYTCLRIQVVLGLVCGRMVPLVEWNWDISPRVCKHCWDLIECHTLAHIYVSHQDDSGHQWHFSTLFFGIARNPQLHHGWRQNALNQELDVHLFSVMKTFYKDKSTQFVRAAGTHSCQIFFPRGSVLASQLQVVPCVWHPRGPSGSVFWFVHLRCAESNSIAHLFGGMHSDQGDQTHSVRIVSLLPPDCRVCLPGDG